MNRVMNRSRWYKKKRRNILCLLVIVVAMLLIVGIFAWRSEKIQQKKIELIIADEHQKREEEEKKLYISSANFNIWANNDVTFPYELVMDTESILENTKSYSAYINNARNVIALEDMEEAPEGKQYVWRFWVSSTNEKQLAVSNGIESILYTIGKEPTQIYTKIGTVDRLSIEVKGGKQDFGEIIVGDSQIISIDENNIDDDDFGQFLNNDVAKSMVQFEDVIAPAVALTDERGIFEELASLNMADITRVKINKDEYQGMFYWNNLDGFDVNEKDIWMIDFVAHRTSGSGKLRLSVNDGEYTAERSVTTQNHEYVFPITGIEKIEDIALKADLNEQGIQISNFKIYKAFGDTINLPGGSYLVDAYDDVTIEEKERIADNALACLVDGDKIYRLQEGKLLINYRKADGSLGDTLAELNGLGDTREMVFIKDCKALAITSRENGVYFVDVSNVEVPEICSNYDTLGMATGISTMGDYVAVCGRFFGTEIIDISDLYFPKYCSCVSNIEEYYDCFMADGYLYVSVWANQCIEVYSLKDVYHPVSINRVPLDGNGGGCYVENNILYVATGYCREGKAENEFDSAFGTGTGLEVFDVSDPSNIEWLSQCMIDGRYYISGFDHWKVIVSSGYAYMSSVSNGVYIYDVSNPSEPKRIRHISVNIPMESEAFKPLSNVYILPEGGKGGDKDIITDIALDNGLVYITGYRSGTYVLKYPNAQPLAKIQGNLNGQAETKNQSISIEGYTSSFYKPENAAVYATAIYEEKIYVACGSDGIVILDKELNVLQTVKTSRAVMDIVACNGYVYTAEAENGLGVYSISDRGLTKVGTCTIADNSSILFSQIQMLGNEKYILVQAGWTIATLVDVSDSKNPIVLDKMNLGLMYSRNLCSGNIQQGKKQYSGVFSRNKVVWYDETGKEIVEMPVALVSESDGAAAFGDKVLVLNNRGYMVFDPISINEDDLNEFPHYYIDNIKLRGKPSVHDDLLVVSYGYGKKITIVNIKDVENPELIANIEVEGTPDVAEITDDAIYIPLRRNGLLILKKK